MDVYLNKLRGFASSAANAVQSKIGRDYDVNLSGTPIGEAGLWSLFRATRRSSGQIVTVWVFEKRYFEQGINRQLFTTREQDLVLNLLKREASQLTRLRHPSVLQVVEPLEETRGSMIFVTEQVIASLDDLVNTDHKNASYGGYSWKDSSRVVDGEEFELDDLEIQKGLLQVSKGLQFLHNDAKILHGNLVPASVLINAKGDWKLGGFGFAKNMNSIPGQDGISNGNGRAMFEHDYQLPTHTQQNLDFLAPEFVLEGTFNYASDLFSLGCLACAVYQDGKSPLDCRNDIGAYKREINKLTPDKMNKLPEYLTPVVRALLAPNPSQRLTLEQFQKSKYFDNILVATLRYLEALFEQPADQKIAFMRGLPRVSPKFSDRILRRKVLPALLEQTNDHSLLPFTLPNIFFIVEKLTPKEFVDLALPGLKPVFSVHDPPQTSIVLLDHLELLQKKAPSNVFKSDVMPLIYTALMSNVPQVQEKALQAVPNISEMIDYSDVKDQLFPRVQHIYSKASVLAVKIRALICLHGMLKSLDKSLIIEKLLPLMKRTKTREPGVMMAMLVMYEELGMKYLDKEAVAKDILPQLWAQCIDSQLRLAQFQKYTQTIKKLSDKVEAEQLKHLEEVQKIEDQTSRASISSSNPLDGAAQNLNDGFSFVDSQGSGSGNAMFNSLVMGNESSNNSGSSAMPDTLVNPLQGMSVSQPLVPSADNGVSSPTLQPTLNPREKSLPWKEDTSKEASGWEWDAPAFNEKQSGSTMGIGGFGSVGSPGSKNSGLGKNIPVDSESANGGWDDDFGDFGSYTSPKMPNEPTTGNTQQRSNKQIASRLRTSPAAHASMLGGTASRFGATKLSGSGSSAMSAATKFPSPPKPSTGNANKMNSTISAVKPNYNIQSFNSLQPKQAANSKPISSFGNSQPLIPTPKSPPTKNQLQSHAGGKAAHLDDFDPFA